MLRHLLLDIASFALSLMALHNVDVQASHIGNDYINFQSGTVGYDYDGDGRKEWCWSQYWHPTNALDIVPQTGPTSCPSLSTEWVHITQHGWTNWSVCTVSWPCTSLHVWEIDSVDGFGCDYVDCPDL